MDIHSLLNKQKNSIEEVDGSLAIGLRVPNTIKDPLSYLSEAKEYSRTDHSIKRQIELCNMLYKYEGTIGTAIDILVDFAVTDIWAEDTGSRQLDKILAYFNDNVNSDNTNTLPGIEIILQQLCLEFFLSGNAFPYTFWKKVNVPGKASPISLPMSITLLNPKSINIAEDAFAFGQEILEYTPDANIYNVLRKDGRTERKYTQLRNSLPDSMLKKIKSGAYTNVVLDPDYVTHIRRKTRDYEPWGTPYLVRTFAPMAVIKKLRKLDEATTEGLINLLTIFKIGTDEFPAGKDRLQAFGQLLSDPTATTTLVWAHDLDVQQIGPDGKILAFKDKYKEAYEELLRALGLPVAMYGQGSIAWEDMLALAEKLKSWRMLVKKWIEKIYRQIAVENGYEDYYPECKMGRMNLSDDESIKNVIMQFWDRGLLDPDTALREAGYNTEGIIEKKKRFAPEAKLFLPPQLPFTGQDNKSGVKAPVTKKPAKPKSTVNLKPEVRR